MILHYYETSGGKNLILDYINKLSNDEQTDGLLILDRLEEGRFDELTIKPWQGKVWEVYFYKHNRIFYVTIKDTDIYLLHACRKQKNRTENNDKNIAIKRAKELGELLSVKFL